MCGNTGWNNGISCSATNNAIPVVVCWGIVISGHRLSHTELYANKGIFSIAVPEPATVDRSGDFNQYLVDIPVSRGRRVVDAIRTI